MNYFHMRIKAFPPGRCSSLLQPFQSLFFFLSSFLSHSWKCVSALTLSLSCSPRAALRSFPFRDPRIERFSIGTDGAFLRCGNNDQRRHKNFTLPAFLPIFHLQSLLHKPHHLLSGRCQKLCNLQRNRGEKNPPTRGGGKPPHRGGKTHPGQGAPSHRDPPPPSLGAGSSRGARTGPGRGPASTPQGHALSRPRPTSAPAPAPFPRRALIGCASPPAVRRDPIGSAPPKGGALCHVPTREMHAGICSESSGARFAVRALGIGWGAREPMRKRDVEESLSPRYGRLPAAAGALRSRPGPDGRRGLAAAGSRGRAAGEAAAAARSVAGPRPVLQPPGAPAPRGGRGPGRGAGNAVGPGRREPGRAACLRL